MTNRFAPRYRLYAALARGFGKLSTPALRRLAAALAFLFWHLSGKRRRKATAAIQRHLGLPEIQARAVARRSFTENFISFLEIFHTGHFFTHQSVREIRTPETYAMFTTETAPMVIATAHIGSWELMPGLAPDLLPDRPNNMVVVRGQRDPDLTRLMAELRGARGMRAVSHRQASAVVLPKLRDRGLAAFLVDHNTNRREAVFLPFLGDIAAVNAGPATLALRAKAAVYPVFLLRHPEGGHILHIFPPLRTAELSGGIHERIERIAAYYTDAVAEAVRLYPEQWFWMHDRWKTREKRRK